MRADEREKLLKEIEKKEHAETTRSMYFRVGKSAYKAITELAAISGTNKSEIVRKLVTKGLTGRDIEIGQETQSVKLDWLVKESKRNRVDIDALKEGIKVLREQLESAEIHAGNTEKVLAEIYCLLMMDTTLSKSSLIRLIRLTARNPAESEYPDLFADRELFDHIPNAVSDLDEMARFHDINIGSKFGDAIYLGSKSEKIRKRINDQVKRIKGSTGEARQ